jgi:hypothetical protein
MPYTHDEALFVSVVLIQQPTNNEVKNPFQGLSYTNLILHYR